MTDKHFKQPVVVNDDGTAAAASSKPLATTGANADIVESVPKSLKSKADRLILEGAAIPGSKMMGLIHDVLRKRKQCGPIGWLPFVKHLKDIPIPMELVGSADRR